MAQTTDAEDLASFLSDGEDGEQACDAQRALQISVEALMARMPTNDLDE